MRLFIKKRKNMSSININFPFDHSGDGSYLKLTSTTIDAVRSNLMHLLMTQKGERLYLPEFGTNLRRHLFNPNDDITLNDIKSELSQDIKKYMPYIILTEMSVKRNEQDSSRADIYFKYMIENSGYNDIDELTIII